MTPISQSLADVFARIREITESPEYQANTARIAAEDAEYERKQAEHRRTNRLRQTGVPPEVAEGLHTAVTPSTLAASKFTDGPKELRFLILSGAKGLGKTYALGRAIWTLGGRYLDAVQLVSTSSFDAGVWLDLSSCRLLAIDELGAELPNPAFEANLYALLDRRYRQGLKTLMATNLNAADFKVRYCEHGLDRLLERLKTGGRWVALDGPSLRKNWQDTDDQETK